MHKKTTSTYDQFVNALLDATQEFLSNPKIKLTYPEAIGALYAFTRITENFVINKMKETDKGENDE